MQPQATRITQIVDHAGQDRLLEDQRITLGPISCVQLFSVKSISDLSRQMYSAIEIRNAITTDNPPPGLGEHFLSIFAVDLLPHKEFGCFRVQNKAIKIEEKGFGFHIAAILSELYRL